MLGLSSLLEGTDLLNEFEKVFPLRPIPKAPRVDGGCDDCKLLEKALKGRDWGQIAPSMYETLFTDGYFLLKEEGRAYYLPGMVLSLFAEKPQNYMYVNTVSIIVKREISTRNANDPVREILAKALRELNEKYSPYFNFES